MSESATVLPTDFFERLSRPPASDDPHARLGPLRTHTAPRLRSGELVVARHAEVVDVLRNTRFLKPGFPPVPFPAARTLLRMFLLLNPPDHPRLRRAVAPVFTPAATEARRGQIVERAERLLEGRREIEVIEELAYPLPLGTIADALGVPAGDERRLAAWGVTLLATLDNPMPLTPAGALRMAKAVALRRSHPVALVRTINQVVRYARARILDTDSVPTDADILRSIQGSLADGTMSLDEAVATWVLVVVAGHETTANLIGNTLHLLLQHPEQLAAVLDDPSLVASAVREALRYESPVPLAIRVADAPTAIGDRPVPAGTTALVLIAAANRDPEVFEHADRFDIGRRDGAHVAHVAFGHGSHICIGAQLATLEAEVAVAAVLRRSPSLRLAPAFRPRWRATFATRGIERLPIVL